MSTRTPLQRLLLRSPNPQYHLLSPVQQRLQCRRNFSNSASVQKGGNAFMPEQPQQRQPPQKSFAVLVEQQRKNAQQPNDVGLAPLTFIMPTGKSLPTSSPSTFLPYAKALIARRLKDAFSRNFMRVWYVKPRPNLQTRAIPTIAQDLYTQMYTSFATGDLAPIAPKLCESIISKLESRIAARAPNTFLRWTLHKYLGSPRIVSHKFLPMSQEKDKTKQTALQQVVVKIRSLQSLERVRKVRKGGKVTEVEEEGSVATPKDVVEYFVVQRRLNRGVWGAWMVWGTTQETVDLEGYYSAGGY